MKLLISSIRVISLLLCICGGVLFQTRSVYSQDEAFPIIAMEGEQTDPSVAYNLQTTEMMITWVNIQDRQYDILAERLNQDGNPIGNEIPIDVTAQRQSHPTIVVRDKSGEYLITWQSVSSTGMDTIILGKIIESNGSHFSDPIPVGIRPGRQANPTVAYCSTADSYLAVWSEDVDAHSPWLFYILGQAISDSGIATSEAITVSADFPGPAFQQIDVDIAYNPTQNEFFTVFRDARFRHTGSGSNDDIFGQRLRCDGSIVMAEDIPISLQFSQPPGGNGQNDPSIAYNSQNNHYLVVWEDSRNEIDTAAPGVPLDVYGQLVSADGELVGTDEKTNFPISVAEGNQENVDLVYSPLSGVYLVVWQDSRGADTDIYGQFIGAGGNLIGEEVVIRNAPGNQQEPAIVYNRSTGKFLVVWSEQTDLYGRWILPPIPSEPPKADAGPDQSVTDNDRNGSENVVLDGSSSNDNDGVIVSYHWRSDTDVTIPDGVNPTVEFPIGTHNITLTVTDNESATDRDSVVITVLPLRQLPAHSLIVGEADITGPSSHHEIYVNHEERHQTIVRTGGGDFSQWFYKLTKGEIITGITESEYITKVNELFVRGCGGNGCEIVTVVEIQDAQHGRGVEAESVKHRRQSWFSSLATISLNPIQPRLEDSIQIVMSGVWWNTCTPEYGSHQIRDNHIVLQVTFPEIELSGTTCAQTMTSWDFSINLETLPLGHYTVSGMNVIKTFMVANTIFYLPIVLNTH